MKTKTVLVSSIFPAAPDAIWKRLTRVETLRYITAPYVSFTPADPDQPLIWRVGPLFSFRLRVFGLFPMGMHVIKVKAFDRERLYIETKEANRTVRSWKHTITLLPLGGAQTRYIDRVEIDAGRLTGVVCLWARVFYRHRQKKWLRLLKDAERKDTD